MNSLYKYTFRSSLLLFLTLILVSPQLARAERTIAISYFDNTSGDVKYNPLSKGIADMLITDLSKVPKINIVEREKLEKLIQEIDLGNSKYFDQKTAQKLGKGLGAESILTGAFLVLDDMLRIDARLVDVASGKILTAESVSGSKDDFFALHAKLVQLLVKELKIDYSASAGAKAKNVKLDAVVQYSTAIDYYDKGLSADASELLASTVKNNPGFTFAKNRLESIKQLLAEVEVERERLIQEETKNLLTNLDPNDPKVGTQINQIWSTLMTSQSYSKILEINKQLQKKNLTDDFKLWGEASTITFGEMRYYYDALSYYTLKDYQNTLIAGEAFIKRYPTSLYFSGIKTYMGQAIAEIEAREKGKAEIDERIQWTEFETYVDQFEAMGSNYRVDFMSEDTYKKYKDIFVKRILNFGDDQLIAYINAGGVEANALMEFKDVAMHFFDIELMGKISEKAILIYSDTEKEDIGYRIESEIERNIEKIGKLKERISAAKETMKKSNETELFELASHFYQLDDGLDWQFMLEISNKVIDIPYQKENEYRIRYAWEMRINALAHMRKLDEAKKQLEAYKVAKDLVDTDGSKKHTTKYRSLRRSLSEAKKSIKRAEEDEVSRAIYKARAYTYGQNHQYVDEAYTRRAIIEKFELDPDEGAMQLSYIMTAYTYIGYFDKVREVGLEIKARYPGSTYEQSVNATLQYLPK